MKALTLLFAIFLSVPLFAAPSGADALSSSSEEIAKYVPFLRLLCYAIAGVLAVVAAYYGYFNLQEGDGNSKKKIMMCVGSAVAFISLSFALPSFFGVDSDIFGYSGDILKDKKYNIMGTHLTTKGGSYLVSDEGGISRTGIIVEIPSMNYEGWVNLPPTVPPDVGRWMAETFIKNKSSGITPYLSRAAVRSQFPNLSEEEITTYHLLFFRNNENLIRK